MKISDLRYELRTDGEDCHALKAGEKPTPERRLAVRIETVAGVPVSAAAIVHAAASLYLGLAARNLRDAVAAGFSLADVATSHTLSLAGLERALQNALRRVRGGVDLLELALKIEEALDVSLPDRLLSAVRTYGDLVAISLPYLFNPSITVRFLP